MQDLWSVLKYDERASLILSSLAESQTPILLTGAPGIGKSWLASGVGVMWEEAGGSTVVAQGDRLSAGVSYYAFGFAMSGLSNRWRVLFKGLGGVARAGEALLGTGGLITSSIEALAHARQARGRGTGVVLSETEQDILHRLERLAKHGPLLLIADNLHWWDAQSIEFLGRLRTSRMTNAYRFLENLRILAVSTPEPYQSVVAPDIYEQFTSPTRTTRVRLPRISREQFGPVLQALGAPAELNAGEVDAIYALSGGHLALASRCADQLARRDFPSLAGAADREEFLRRILLERMESLGERGRNAIELLHVAAVLGLTFRRDELTCASGGDESSTSQILRDCRAEAMVSLDDGVGSFEHDLYREFFLSQEGLDPTATHERLLGCLRLLRPGEYESRCINARDAERYGEAAALSVQAGIQRLRDGLDWRGLSDEVLSALGPYHDVMVRFDHAYRRLNEYRYTDCLDALSGLPHNLPRSLLAEAAYARATCLMVTRNEDDRRQARALLEGWKGWYETEEAELGTRMMQLLAYAYSMLVDKTAGLALEASLRRFLADRARYDDAAEDSLYTLDRCAGRFHVPERAVLAGRDAVNHFAPASKHGTPKRPIEYYRSLVNLSANLMVCSRHEEAMEVHAAIDRLIAGFESDTFPRQDYCSMNKLLSEFRLGRLDANEAAARQSVIADTHAVEGDLYYVRNALAVYTALAGDLIAASDILRELERRLEDIAEPSPSIEYTVSANLACVRFVMGDADAAFTAWRRLSGVLGRVPYVIVPYLQRRHELLSSVMATGGTFTAPEFDQVLLNSHPHEIGPLWQQLGHGFWLPEIEWWR
jgi:hypothetical protein